jgi:hypothetical protein
MVKAAHSDMSTDINRLWSAVGHGLPWRPSAGAAGPPQRKPPPRPATVDSGSGQWTKSLRDCTACSPYIHVDLSKIALFSAISIWWNMTGTVLLSGTVPAYGQIGGGDRDPAVRFVI